MAELTSHTLDHFLNDVRLMAENQRELLLGDIVSPLTTTQGHLLMLLAQGGAQTNTQLAHELQVSPAAVTKAVKSLQHIEPTLVISQRDAKDARILRWALTAAGAQMASDHAAAHDQTVAAYDKMLAHYDDSQREILGRFLTDLSLCLRNNGVD